MLLKTIIILNCVFFANSAFAESAISVDGSLSVKDSVPAEDSLPAEDSTPAEGSIPAKGSSLKAGSVSEKVPSSEYKNIFNLSLEELTKIKVSVASFNEETRLESGSTVSSINEQTWRNYGAKNVLDLLQHQPGMKSHQTLAGSPALSVRGFTNSLSAVRGHAIIIDGVSNNTFSRGTGAYASTLFDLNLMQNVEFLRGPASVLYGSDAFHSVVSMKSWESEKDTLETGTRAGSFGYSSSYLRGSQAISNKFRLTTGASFTYNHDSEVAYDYTDANTDLNVGLFNREKLNKSSLMLKFDSDNFSWITHYLDAETEEFTGLAQGLGSNQEGRRSSAKENKVVFTRLAYTHHLQNNLHLDLSASHLEKNVFTNFDIGGSQPKPPETIFTAPDSITLGLALPDTKQLVKVELKNVNDQQLSWSMGTEATTHNISGTVRTFSSNPGAIDDSEYEDYNREVYSFWVNSKYKINNYYNLIAGFRSDDYEDIDYLVRTPRLGIVYFPEKNTAIKLLYGQAFRAPAAIETAGGATILGSADIKPEIMKTTELVFMKNTKHYESSATLFYSKWQDGIRLEPTQAARDVGKDTQYINAARNISYGLEFELKKSLENKNIMFTTSGSYIRSRNDENDSDYHAFPTYIFNWGGTWLVPASKWSVSLFNRHEFDRHASSDMSSDKLASYFRTDLAVNWIRDNKLEASINVINLFNRENINPSVWKRSQGQAEPDIDASASLRYKF